MELMDYPTPSSMNVLYAVLGVTQRREKNFFFLNELEIR